MLEILKFIKDKRIFTALSFFHQEPEHIPDRYMDGLTEEAVEMMGCEVTSNMTSLVVLNLPPDFAGREMELVQACRAQNFGIWPTLSAPVQVRIGILNQLSSNAISDIAVRFAEAMNIRLIANRAQTTKSSPNISRSMTTSALTVISSH